MNEGYITVSDFLDIDISEDDYAKIVLSTDYSEGWVGLGTGAKVQVKGVKSVWSGEVEIIDATFEIMEGNYVAGANIAGFTKVVDAMLAHGAC